MAVYNKPQIQILNNDNLVYRDKPYILQFKITQPTLAEDISENYNYINKNILDSTHDEYIYELNLSETIWTITDNKINITNLEIIGDNEDILQVTGKKVLSYMYKVYFNDTLIKETSNPIANDITDNVNIQSSAFNNFVDGVIKIEVNYGYNEILTESKNYNLQLVNTAPNMIIGDIVNNKLNITISDTENDTIQMNIKLNGKDYLPANGGFTDLIITPYFYTTIFNSDELNINPKDFNTPNNIVTITIKDKYGAETQLHKSFIGEFYGLMFVDENGDFYSTDSNDYIEDKNILKELYLGNIKAGTIGEKKIIYLQNKSRNKLTNIKLTLNTVGVPEKTYVKMSKSNLDNFNDMSNTIDFGSLQLNVNEKLPFYVQGNTEILSLGGGYFYVDVIADAIE